MFIVKVKEDTELVINKICRSFIVCFIDYSLEIATSIVRVPNQDEFFNVLPLLKQVRKIAHNQLMKRLNDGIQELDKMEEPGLYLTTSEDNRDLISNKPVNICVVLGMEEVASNMIRPFIDIKGATTYKHWAFVHGAINKLISHGGNRLANMELDLIDDRTETKSTSEIMASIDD